MARGDMSHGRDGVPSDVCCIPARWECFPPAPAGCSNNRLTPEEELMDKITSTEAISPDEIAKVLELSNDDVARFNHLNARYRAGVLSTDEERDYNSLPLKLRVYSACCITWNIGSHQPVYHT